MNIKIQTTYVYTQNRDDLEKEVNQTLEGIQVNSKNNIVDIKTIEIEKGFLTTIVYNHIEEEPDIILNEGVVSE